MQNDAYSLTPIGHIVSPYKEKFAIPRQANLVPAARGKIVLSSAFSDINLVRGLEQFSHLWLQFIFHQTIEQGWQPLVRPPRLGGNDKVGVLASRSPFRPNGLGLSVVEFHGVEQVNGSIVLNIAGMDLLDNTPVLDIKPYVAYADSIIHAKSGFAQTTPELKPVQFTQQAEQQLHLYSKQYHELGLVITQVLQQDPRPAYKKNKLDTKLYGMRLYDFNIQFRCEGELITVVDIVQVVE